jgi:ABC-2 type transport system permease protein
MRWSIVRVQTFKELNQFRRDKLTVALAFVLPVAGLLMYGFATRLEAKDIPVSVINHDIGKLSRELVDRIYATVQLIPAKSVPSNILQPLDTADARAVVVIPPEFSRDIQAGRTASVQAIIDGSDVNNARVVQNALIATTQSFQQATGLIQAQPLIHAAIRLWYNPGRKEALYIVPGSIGLLLWVFPAILSTLAFAREKEQGTILQVYASNLTSTEFMAGKAIAYVLVASGEALCLLLTSIFVFGLRMEAEPITFLLCTILYLGNAVLFGLWAGTKAHNQMAAIQIVANIGFLTTMLLSGFIYPLRNIVWPLSLVSYIVPAMYYVLVCRNAFVRGGDWFGLWYAPLFFIVFNVFMFRVLSHYKMKLSEG